MSKLQTHLLLPQAADHPWHLQTAHSSSPASATRLWPQGGQVKLKIRDKERRSSETKLRRVANFSPGRSKTRSLGATSACSSPHWHQDVQVCLKESLWSRKSAWFSSRRCEGCKVWTKERFGSEAGLWGVTGPSSDSWRSDLLCTGQHRLRLSGNKSCALPELWIPEHLLHRARGSWQWQGTQRPKRLCS